MQFAIVASEYPSGSIRTAVPEILSTLSKDSIKYLNIGIPLNALRRMKEKKIIIAPENNPTKSGFLVLPIA